MFRIVGQESLLNTISLFLRADFDDDVFWNILLCGTTGVMLACACEAETAACLCSGGFALLGTVFLGSVVEAAEGREGRPRRLAEDLDMGVDGMSIGEFV
jgi:hypothetical protein